ncbi:MAG: histidinol-phosphate transaminase, partial [Bradymonadaceae bacterium]
LLVELPVDGEPVYEAMLERGVITRPMHGYGLPEHLRVTIGTEEQNTRFLSAFDAALDEVLV